MLHSYAAMVVYGQSRNHKLKQINMFQTQHEIEEDFHGSVQEEGHKDWIQSFGEQSPHKEWILSDWDVWERNPYFTGTPTQGHPEANG